MSIPVSLSKYCEYLIRRFHEVHPLETSNSRLHDLVASLQEVERENTEVTSAYRKLMGQLSYARTQINLLLKDSVLSMEDQQELLTAKATLTQRMETATHRQLEVTREFEARKESINQTIADLTGEPLARVQAVLNRFYIDEAQDP